MDSDTLTTRRAVLGSISALGLGGGAYTLICGDSEAAGGDAPSPADQANGSTTSTTLPAGQTPGDEDRQSGVTATRDDTATPTLTDTAGPSPSSPIRVESIPQLYSSSETTAAGIDLTNLPVMGSADAPVDIYYWGDYQCPFCKQFESNTLASVVEKLVAPGTARLIFLEYPNIGAASEPAAVMRGCVWRQVKDDDPKAFYRWHRTIYQHQEQPRSGWAATENLLDITRDVEGVDADAVAACMDQRGDAIRDHVDEQVKAAESNGINATPSFIVANRSSGSGRKIAGAQPYPMFAATVKTVQ